MKTILEASKSNPDSHITQIERIMLLDVNRDISNIRFYHEAKKDDDEFIGKKVKERIICNFHNAEQKTSCGKTLRSFVILLDVDVNLGKAVVTLDFEEV